MADFDPKAFLAEDDFDPKAFLSEGVDTGAPGSPLEKALASQSGEMVTVETPTGPAMFDRQGRRVSTGAEYAAASAPDDAKFKDWLLGGATAFFGSGGKLIDELRGADAAVKTGMQVAGAGGNPIEPMQMAYNQTRNETRKVVADQQAAHPIASVAGAVAPFLAAPSPATVGGRIVTGGASAAIDEVGGSTADDFTGLAKDVLMAGGGGMALSGAAEGLLAPLRWAARGASREADAAADVVQQAKLAELNRGTSSQIGTLRNIVGQEMSSVDAQLRVVNNPALHPPQRVQEALDFLASSKGRELLDRTAENSLDLAGSLANKEDAARAALAQSVTAANPNAVRAWTQTAVKPTTVASDVGRRFLKSQGERLALGAAGAGAGGLAGWLMGDDWKSGAGGAIFGGGLGFKAPPGTVAFLRNTFRSPAVQSSTNRVASDIFSGAAGVGSRGARSLEPGMAQEARQSAYAELMEKWGLRPESPEDASAKAFLLMSTEPAAQPK